jgi:hypothetical protein
MNALLTVEDGTAAVPVPPAVTAAVLGLEVRFHSPLRCTGALSCCGGALLAGEKGAGGCSALSGDVSDAPPCPLGEAVTDR